MKTLSTLSLSAILLLCGFNAMSQTTPKKQKVETKIESSTDKNDKGESRISIRINKDGNETIIDTIISSTDQKTIDAIISSLDNDSSMKEIKKTMSFSFNTDDMDLENIEDELKNVDKEVSLAILSPLQKEGDQPREIRIEKIRKPSGNMFGPMYQESLMLSYDKMNTMGLSAKEKKILNKAIYKYNKRVSQLVK